MPTVNVPAPVRFGLYLFSAVGTVVIGYLVAKNYVGEAETAAWGGLVAIINVLAASNVNLAEEPNERGEAGHRLVLGFFVVVVAVAILVAVF